MQEILLNLEYCYGISHLTYKFDFSNKNVYSIYAPNGSMKSSFAKVFKDLSQAKESTDRIFSSRNSKREILKDNNIPLTPDEVFVIDSYNKDYSSDSVSLLLANQELKNEYDSIYNSINTQKENFCQKLKKLSGVKNDVEKVFAADISSKKDFFIALNRIKSEVVENQRSRNGLEDIKYDKIFNDKSNEILNDISFVKHLNEYMNIYDTLLEKSTFFQKGVFNHNNASEIAKRLKENNFFKARNTINVYIDGEKKELNSETELETIIEKEKKSIIENPDLISAFNKIDAVLSKNKNLKDFREYLEAHKEVLPELKDINAFKEKLWIAYISTITDEYNNLIKEYEISKEKLENISQRAKEQRTEWQEVVDEFNRRYSVPFEVSISNQIDVILSGEIPVISFSFVEENTKEHVERSLLLDILSQGEKRALYILNIIFEIKARIKKGLETLLIIDDIADSFDYKNKYAIIEYLKDIANEPLFKLIILTHNFDFYRNASNRLGLAGNGHSRKYRLYAVRMLDKIELIEEKYQKNPFETWKSIENPYQQIALIPFMRNIAQYTNNESVEKKLTTLLHQKVGTSDITGNELQDIYSKIYAKKPDSGEFIGDKSVERKIYELARELTKKSDDFMELENKIVLSIAIRLKAEKYMIEKIKDDNFLKGITSNQTVRLVTEFKRRFPLLIDEIAILEQVNLMTPENIHLNSFMYEPILDMSGHHLVKLYTEVLQLQ